MSLFFPLNLLSAKPTTSPSYRPELDGLRALAIVAVLINHAFDGLLPGGYLGVDIFFALSGYVVTRSIRHRQHQQIRFQRTFLLQFYSRRIRRLYPALLLMISVVIVLAALFLSPADFAYESSWRTGLSAIWGASNIQLWRTSSDYFSSSVSFNLFTHTWSLGVEEQFYLLFPLLWCVIPFKRIGSIVAALSAASWLFFVWSSAEAPITAFYLLPARFWELGCGVLISLWEMPLLVRFPWAKGRSIQGLILFLLLCLLLLPSQPGWVNSLVISLTCILILGLTETVGLGRIFSMPILVLIGLLSYGLYLWHWPLLLLAKATFAAASQPPSLSLLILISTFFISLISYHCIEQPIRNNFTRYSSQRTLLVGAGVSSFASIIIYSLINAFPGRAYLGVQPIYGPVRANAGSQHQTAPSACNLFSDSAASKFSARDCLGVTARPGQPTLYLLGDSHAEQFYSAARTYVGSKGWGLKIAVANSCPFPSLRLSSLNCARLQLAVEDALVKRIKSGDVVLVASSWLPFIPAAPGHASKSSLTLIKSGINRLADLLNTKGARLILYLDGPQFEVLGDVSPARCTYEWFRPVLPLGCELRLDHYLSRRQPLSEAFLRHQSRPHVEIWDPAADISCAQGICRPEGYIDSTHYSVPLASELFFKYVSRSRFLGASRLP